MKTSNQISLFPEPTKKVFTFNGLSLHEKINYKANQCGFQGTVYLSRYYYFNRPLHKPQKDMLSKHYFIHYRLNAGGGNRLDTWRKKNINGKDLF